MNARPAASPPAARPDRQPVPGDHGSLTDLTSLVRRLPDIVVPAGTWLLALDETGGGLRCHKQRAADAAISAAAREGYRRVAVGSCGNYGWAVARAAAAAGMDAIVVVPAGFAVDTSRMTGAGARVLRAGATYEDAVATSRELVTRRGHVADLNVDGPYAAVVAAAHRRIVDAVADLPGGPPTALWIPLGNGTTLAAAGRAILDRGWRTRPVGVTSGGNNSVFASWPGRRHQPLDPDSLSPTAVNEPLVNVDALHGQPAIDVLHASGGHAVAADDSALRAAARLLRHAGLRVSPAGAAGVAGLLDAVRGGISGGAHVALLTG